MNVSIDRLRDMQHIVGEVSGISEHTVAGRARAG